MNVLGIQNCEVEDFGLYAHHLLDRRIPFQVVHAYAGDRLPMLATVDAILVGGTPIPAYEIHKPPFLRKEIQYLGSAIAADKPCFGICFGAQVLAQILGADSRAAEQMEIGGSEVRVTPAGAGDPLLRGFPGEFPVFQWHGDMFEIPLGGDLLVEGDACRNQMFRSSIVAGVLFHMELTAADAGRWAEAYPDDLARAGKSREQVVEECRKREREMGALAAMLMDNFLEGMA
jgi:GMP synthase (glutamine-hydrolysing)